jgi:prepilin-type N-terminal cleavage/methylation domain-containing protein
MTRRYQPLGFTLVEILVALTIIATIVSMVYGSYVAASGSAQSYTQRATILQKGQLALHQLAAQIRCLYVPETVQPRPAENNPPSRLDRDVSKMKPQMSLFVGSGKPQGDILQFVTMKSLPLEQTQVQTRWTTLVTFERETSQLILSQWPFNGKKRQEAHKRNYVILADGVIQITLAYYNGSQWQSQWNSQECHTLPQAVRCDLILVDSQNKRYRSHIITPVLCSTSAAYTLTKETSP